MGTIVVVLCALGALSVTSASACANEALRPSAEAAAQMGLAYPGSQLPDCRAFEQATPVDKNGGDAMGTLAWVKAAPQGGGISFISTSGIPGGVGGQEFPGYLASRIGGAWGTHGMLPPASAGQDAGVLGWTPDFSEVFTRATKLGAPSETELLATPGNGGTPTVLVGYTPGFKPAIAATTKGGSLLFEASIKLEGTAGVPGKPNVYLWDRESGQVSLVGVLNDLKAPSQGTIAGPYDWVRGTNPVTLSEGGGARGYYTQDEHAISTDGKVVYFTAAGSGKLYARLNPTAPQSPLDGDGKCTDPAKACTIEVSASEKTNGTGPGKTELGGPRPAAFQGASVDGKVAYFTSSEELTEDANTGPEPTELPPPPTISRAKLGATQAEEIKHSCIEGRASGLATDETYLYWAEREAGAIGRANRDCSGTPEPGFITGLPSIEDLAVYEGHIYWTEPGSNAIGRADVNNPGNVEAQFITGAEQPKGIAAGCGHLYWTNPGDESESETHFLGRATLGPGGAEFVDQEFIKFDEGGLTVPKKGVAVDCAGSGHIYVATSSYILRFGIDGKKAYNLESHEGSIGLSSLANQVDLALDAAHLYWSEEGSGAHVSPSRICRVNLNPVNEDCQPAQIEPGFIKESEGVEHAQSLAVAGEHVYWANDPPTSPKPGNDLYRYDFAAPAGERLTDLSADPTGNGGEAQGLLGTSSDGSVAYFAANGDLDGPGEGQVGDCQGGLSSASGQCNLYRAEAGQGEPAFVAPLDVGGGQSHTDAMNWAATTTAVGGFAEQFQKTSRVSPDGKTLLFRSQEQLGPYENMPASGVCGSQGGVSFPCPELYRFNTEEGLGCVSCDPGGAAPAGAPDLGNVFPWPSSIPARPASLESHNLSLDGGRVFFETPDALVGADTNGQGGCPLVGNISVGTLHFRCMDVYEWEAAGEGSCTAEEALAEGGCIHLLSSGKGSEPTLLADASADGGDVFFFSRDRLVDQDEDELVDVYDARSEGGIASQNPPPPPLPCESADGCHGSLPAAPGEESPASANFQGPGNVKARHHRAHHKHKRHHGKHHRHHGGGARIARARDAQGADEAPSASAGAPIAPAASEPSASGQPIVSAAPTGAQVAWKLRLEANPTNLVPGKSAQYLVVATEVGAKEATGPIAFTDTLPAGLTPLRASGSADDPGAAPIACEVVGQAVSCESAGPIHPSFAPLIRIDVQVGALPEPSTITDEAEVSGGGASAAATLISPVSAATPPFDFTGFDAPALNEEGGPAVAGGSHPYSLSTDLQFPTVEPGPHLLTSAGHLRDARVDLPPGLIGDPAAAPVLCTEAELLVEVPSPEAPKCPAASQVGTGVAAVGVLGSETFPLYAMVPAPGSPAVFGFEVVGVFIHVSGSLRSDSDYGISGQVNDVLARSLNPILGAGVELWGDPSAESHDHGRGQCRVKAGACPVNRQATAFLTLPTECSGQPLPYSAHADSWEEPGVFKEASYQSADLLGNPVSLEGCGELGFQPTITAQPTTLNTDTPSGLRFDLHQLQDESLQEGAGRSTAALKDVTISFPAGMTVNASQAGGLEACSEAQIGFSGQRVAGRPAFSKAPQSCPDGAKLGSLEVTSPLLVQRAPETHEVEVDPETGEPKLEPLHGAIYLAAPFDNPFGSLVAVYLAIEDKQTGIVAKLAGEGTLDPKTGQITTRFTQNPQLPLEDFKARLFEGPRGALLTPPTCARYTTTAELTPWSAPEGATVNASDSFALRSAPGGGTCPREAAQLPNAPTLSAGTVQPSAGKYSTLLFKLSRADGTQRMGRIEATMPPGISAKLAGVPYCPEADIAKARLREAPRLGALEQTDPSCPAASEIGTITAAAGAGPDPYYTNGRAYLAGPYEGAPLSVVAIAPAVAGPFDLGAVVVRTALYIDPETAQVRAVSDPLPQLLDGVPVDLRKVSLRLDRPSFLRNPTSCAEKAFGGQLVSALGAPAPLSERFQVGGCSSLPYKPRLSLRLFGPTNRGAHPALRAVFTAKPGEAGTARLSFALPHSEFIDQGHFRTICTRVQFAAKQCPAGSIYGHIKATTPLLGYPLEGPIYLRSSSHELPDAVAVLRGPASQPIEVDLDGRVDSVNGGIRTTFETVPDAPVSKAVVTLQGAKKGLFQNSTNICAKTYRATLKLVAQNGKTDEVRPALRASCAKHRKRHGAHHRR
jgi:uncharacterized repeat protein (TIGR01451 family)